MPAALLVTACACLLIPPGHPRAPGGHAAGVALCLTALLWLGVKYAPLAAVLGLVALLSLRPAGRILLAALLLPSAAAYVWFHLAVYGGLTPYSVNLVYAGSTDLELVGRHLEIVNRLYRLAGLWIDGEFGILRWAPALALALPGIPLLLPGQRPWAWVIVLLLFAVQFAMAVFFSITMRGWWFPGRMLIAVLPLLAVPIAALLAVIPARPLLGAVAALLAAFSLALTLALLDAAGARAVVLAVDPFMLDWPPFRALAGIFPVYTDYGPATWALTAGWLIAAAALLRLGAGLKTTAGTGSRARPGRVAAGAPEAP